MIPTLQNGQVGRGFLRNYDRQVLRPPNVAFYWKLDEASGTSYADASGNGKTGTGSGAITQSQAPLFNGSRASVLFGSAGVIQRANPFTAQSGPFSVEAMFRLNSLAADCYIWGRGYGPGATDWGSTFRITTNGQAAFLLVVMQGGTSVLRSCVSAVGAITTGVAHHVICSWAPGTGTTLYLDGVATTLGFTDATMRSTTSDFVVGQGINNTTSCAGRISNVIGFNTTMSARDVLTHYNTRNRLQ